jgi:hypothetical protein
MTSEDEHVLRVTAQMLAPKMGSPTPNSGHAVVDLGDLDGELGSEDPALQPVKKRLITGVALRQPQSDRVTVVACTFTRTLVLLRYRALDVREP